MKKIIKKTTALLIVTVMFTSAVSADTPVVDSTKGTLYVSGNATIEVEPDMAVLTFNISEKHKKMDVAVNSATKKVLNTTNALLESNYGIKEDDITTNNFYTYPTYGRYDSTKPEMQNKIIGYVVNQQLKININNLDNINSIITLLLDNGIESVGNANYKISNKSDSYNKALVLAIENAQGKAEILANAINGKNLKISSISESYTNNNFYYPEAISSKIMMDSPMDSVSINPGVIKITSQLSITFSYDY